MTEKLRPTGAQLAASRPRRRGHVAPKAPHIDLNVPGRLRVEHLLALFGVSHSTFYAQQKAGRFPQPDGRDGGDSGRPFWRTATIRALL